MFSDGELVNVLFKECEFTNTDFDECSILNVKFERCIFSNVKIPFSEKKPQIEFINSEVKKGEEIIKITSNNIKGMIT